MGDIPGILSVTIMGNGHMQMANDEVLFESEGAVATITLNRPAQFNAMNAKMRSDLLQAINRAEEDAAIRLVIIRGSGRGFCAGADLTEQMPDDVTAMLENEYKPFLVRIAEGSKIYMAQIHGTAAGIGAALAMTCDLATIADNATIYMAFAAIALVPDGGNTWLLHNMMGYHRAMETILEGKHVSAEDCVRFGIANKAFPVDRLDEETRAWAEKIASGAPLAMAAAKRLLRSAGQTTFDRAISAEAREQNILSHSNDMKRGVEAFFAKKKPVFEGN